MEQEDRKKLIFATTKKLLHVPSDCDLTLFFLYF